MAHSNKRSLSCIVYFVLYQFSSHKIRQAGTVTTNLWKIAMINLAAAELSETICCICLLIFEGLIRQMMVSSSNSVLPHVQPSQRVKLEEGQELGQVWQYETYGFVGTGRSPLTPWSTSQPQGHPFPLVMLPSAP